MPKHTLLETYFREHSLVQSDLESFNNFVEKELPRIIAENKRIEPAIIPAKVEDYYIQLDKIRVDRPKLIEADGSERPIMPMEARMRGLTYAAPVYLTLSSHINGIQRETVEIQIASLPVMVKSKYCNLYGLDREKLIEAGEDPDDPGGYFIVNGTEKVLVKIEDLMPNRLLVTRASMGPSEYVGRIFSEREAYKIPHTIERLKDGIYYLSFSRIKRVPLFAFFRALGMEDDEEIMRLIAGEEEWDEVMLNLMEVADVQPGEDAMDYIAKKAGFSQSRDVRIERVQELLDRYFLVHLGMTPESRRLKAVNLAKYVRKFILIERGILPEDDKDHLMNKKLKLSEELLGDLVRTHLRSFVNDIRYNFQRMVKKGKFPSLRSIVREKLLTQKIISALATGAWVGGRRGISQRLDRLNYLAMLSHLQRVVIPLSQSQENFEAREVHPTQLGRICPIETPEGSSIGLRRNLAILAHITSESDARQVYEKLTEYGLQPAEGIGPSVFN